MIFILSWIAFGWLVMQVISITYAGDIYENIARDENDKFDTFYYIFFTCFFPIVIYMDINGYFDKH